MTQPTLCLTCKRKPDPELWECARVECPNRKATMYAPSDQRHDGFEPMLDGYVSRPRLEE